MHLQKSVISYILNGGQNYCCLCLKPVENYTLRLQDEIAFYGLPNTEKMSVILANILGDDFLNMKSALDTICNSCKTEAVNCWSFIKMCKENGKHLCNIVKNLTECFNVTANSSDMKSCKSLFVAIDSNDLVCTYYYDRKQLASSRLRALKIYNALLKKKLKKIKIESDYEDDFNANSAAKCDIVQHSNLNKDFKHKEPPSNASFISTKNMMSGKNELKCKNCYKIYPTRITLRRHYIRVHLPKQFKCTDCSRCYGSQGLLTQHKRYSHTPAVCSQCGKSYNNRHSLKIHELGHNTKIVCEDCGRTYKHKKTFQSHLRSKVCQQKEKKSNSEAKFTCDYCNKRFGHKPTLRGHIQFEHGNSKAFICEWCKKRFNSQSRLNGHVVTHTQEKKFGCDICGGRFVTKTSLLYHTRIHTGEKPYTCQQCNKAFLSASRRSAHIRRHHQDASVECDICHSKFKERSCLLRHKKRHFDPKSKLHCTISALENMI